MTDLARNGDERLTAAEWRRRDEQERRSRDCYEAGHAPDQMTMTFAGVPSPTTCLCGKYIWTPNSARSTVGGETP